MNWLDFKIFLKSLNLSNHQVVVFNQVLLAIFFIAASFLSFYFIRFVIKKLIFRLIRRTTNDYDNTLIKNRVFELIAHVLPLLILFYGVEFIYSNKPILIILNKFIYGYLLIVSMLLVFRILNTLNDVYEIYARKNNLNVHIKQFIEVVKVIIVIIVIIITLSLFFNIKPSRFLTGLGAFTAILILVFKDTILSFVASIQLNVYKLISIGDWISLPSKNVEGDVVDLSLNSIKLRNADNTISTVPTYLFTQEPFVNWKGMEQSGGRRIKRSLLFNANNIRMADTDFLSKLSQIPYISDYINNLLNKINNNPNSISITNLSLFRVYVEQYIRNNLRSFKKFTKVEIWEQDKIVEKFLVQNPQYYIDKFGQKISTYFETIDQKTYINNTSNFLLSFSDSFVYENDYIYEISKVYKKVIIQGVEIDTFQIVKIIQKEGKFCDDLRIIVRELQPTDLGIPLEIYCFAATTNLVEYEQIQSEFFEHLYAVIPIFELKLFQRYSS